MHRRPGPRVAESISVVRATLSPTRTPWVSSKICRSARRPWTRNTSPLSCASPTCTKATEFFMIGASLSILTIFPITPMTRASGVEFGILTQSLRDKCFEDGPTALGLQLLPMADDLPASEVKYDGLEGEVVVLSTFLQVRPCNPQHLPVKVQHIPLLEQLLERQDPGEDMAKPEVGLVEVATDVFEPLPDPDRGWAQAVAAATQRRHDHAYVHVGGEHFTHQGVGDFLHELAVPLHHRCVGGLHKLSAPCEDVQQSIDILGILRLEHAQTPLEPFERDRQSVDIETRRQRRQAADEHIIRIRPHDTPYPGHPPWRRRSVLSLMAPTYYSWPHPAASCRPGRPPPRRGARREIAAAYAGATTR